MTAEPAAPSSDPPSPCIGVCVINPQTQLCDGCFRTLDEIATWAGASDETRLAVLAEVEQRRVAHDPWGDAADNFCK